LCRVTTDAHRAIDAVWRIESAKVIASLTRMVGAVVMAHGDLITRTHAVHNRAPRPEGSLSWYRNTVLNGLAGADAVVAPSTWMLDRISACYRLPH